jgi:putative membrane protein insertion efficiency factor
MLLRLLILGYKNLISPVLPDSCRYHPSCSTYALRAIETHGVAKGFVLGVWRVLRCNPWSGGGWDPVPPRGRWVPPVYPDGTPRD